MGRRLNPKLVGAFVLGAIGLAVLAIVMLGGGRLLSRAPRYVLYFRGSVNGLRVGATVKVRGVPVGSVEKILLSFDPSEEAGYRSKHPDVILIPVVVEVDPRNLAGLGALESKQLTTPRGVRQAVRRGLRGHLGTESLVTGLLFVALDIKPDTPAETVLPSTSTNLEIPTLPTALEKAQEDIMRALSKLQKVDFEALASSLTETLDALRQLAGSKRTQAVIDSLTKTSSSLGDASNSIIELSKTVQEEIGPLSRSVQATSDSASLALKQAAATLATLQGTVDPDSPLGYHLNQTLMQLSAAAREMRDSAEFLERNPSAIVRGKPVGEPNP
jgi:paraquat-inducible protein B